MSGIVERLLQLALEKGALTYGDYTLTSGKKSSYYFDGRLLSLDPEGAHLIAQALLPMLRHADVEAIGVPTSATERIPVGTRRVRNAKSCIVTSERPSLNSCS